MGDSLKRITKPGVIPGETAALEDDDPVPQGWTLVGRWRVEVSPRAEDGEGVLLNRLSVRFSSARKADAPLMFPATIFGALLPVAVSLFMTYSGRRGFRRSVMLWGLAGAVFAVAAGFYYDLLQPLMVLTVSFFLGAGGVVMVKHMTKTEGFDPRIAEACFLAGIVGLAILFRWGAFVEHRNAPLLPDAAGYGEIARTGSFYETSQMHAPWVREPLFPAVLRAWFTVMPGTGVSQRFAGIWLGLLPVVLTWAVGRRLFGPLAGIVAAGMMAATPFLAEFSAEGLRDDLLSGLFLGLIAAVLYLPGHVWARAIAFGMIGAALALLRINNAFLLVPLLAWVAWRQRWKWGEVAVAAALAIVPLVPHLLHNARVGDGDLLYSASVHTRYYYNLAHIGEPGFPATWADWNANPYAGDVIGSGVLLTDGGVLASARRVAMGFVDVFLYRFPHGSLFRGSELAMAFGILGAWALWRRREAWWVAVAYAAFLFPVAVIVPLGTGWRLASPAAPLIFLVWSAGVVLAWDGLVAVWGRWRAGSRR